MEKLNKANAQNVFNFKSSIIQILILLLLACSNKVIATYLIVFLPFNPFVFFSFPEVCTSLKKYKRNKI